MQNIEGDVVNRPLSSFHVFGNPRTTLFLCYPKIECRAIKKANPKRIIFPRERSLCPPSDSVATRWKSWKSTEQDGRANVSRVETSGRSRPRFSERNSQLVHVGKAWEESGVLSLYRPLFRWRAAPLKKQFEWSKLGRHSGEKLSRQTHRIRPWGWLVSCGKFSGRADVSVFY